jgi:hypothetical protein
MKIHSPKLPPGVRPKAVSSKNRTKTPKTPPTAPSNRRSRRRPDLCPKGWVDHLVFPPKRKVCGAKKCSKECLKNWCFKTWRTVSHGVETSGMNRQNFYELTFKVPRGKWENLDLLGTAFKKHLRGEDIRFLNFDHAHPSGPHTHCLIYLEHSELEPSRSLERVGFLASWLEQTARKKKIRLKNIHFDKIRNFDNALAYFSQVSRPMDELWLFPPDRRVVMSRFSDLFVKGFTRKKLWGEVRSSYLKDKEEKERKRLPARIRWYVESEPATERALKITVSDFLETPLSTSSISKTLGNTSLLKPAMFEFGHPPTGELTRSLLAAGNETG